MPSVMVLVGGVFGRCSSHENGTFMNGLVPYKKKKKKKSGSRELPTSVPFHHVRTSEVTAMNHNEDPHQKMIVLPP